ncbi:MAG: Uma2 family endonuclease [Saprospiraceae bacterium]|nr:Uma2 family endonuclease [Saprospiraceae bacterium]
MTTISKLAYSESAKMRRRSKLKEHTLEYYLQREEKAKFKSEFYNGKIIKMAGATTNHNQISAQITSCLITRTKRLENKYKVYNSDQKVFIPSKNSVFYPDALIIADKPEFWHQRKDIITNPLVVVEVLSPSSKPYDVFEKFHLYQELPSFCEYIIISQSEVAIEQWYRKDIDTWVKSEMNALDQFLKMPSLSIEIPLSEIYDDIEFE